MVSRIWLFLSRNFLTGIFLFLPLLLTLWILWKVYHILSRFSVPVINAIFNLTLYEPYAIFVNLLSFTATVTFFIFLGYTGKSIIGKRMLRSIESSFAKIPLIKAIYGSIKQIMDAFGKQRQEGAFKKVVMVEYPRKGVMTIGFVTGTFKKENGDELIGVFFPTTPNPTSGWLAYIKSEEIIPLDINIEDGIKLIVSGGIINPPTNNADNKKT